VPRKTAAKPRVLLPTQLEPQLAVLTSAPPPRGDWLYEIKFDGYRILARIEGGVARLITRRGHDWTDRMPVLAEELAHLGIDDAWIDGEIVVHTAEGGTDFNALQNAFDRRTGAPIVYWLFDAPFLNGRDLRQLGNRERRGLLEKAIGDGTEHVRFSSAFEGDPEPILAEACKRGMEGLIAKRAGAGYVSSRSTAWLKLKCKRRQEFVVAGFTDRADARAQVGSLLLGVYDNAQLRSVGSVGTGWTNREAAALRKKLAALERGTCPFEAGPGKLGRWSRRAVGSEHWIDPAIVAEVEFAEITPDGQVRHASFVGLREDKDPKEVGREG
jgi:bifunctional non-homologous end joining protein LigD